MKKKEIKLKQTKEVQEYNKALLKAERKKEIRKRKICDKTLSGKHLWRDEVKVGERKCANSSPEILEGRVVNVGVCSPGKCIVKCLACGMIEDREKEIDKLEFEPWFDKNSGKIITHLPKPNEGEEVMKGG